MRVERSRAHQRTEMRLSRTLTITSSDEIGELGPVVGSIDATGEGVVVSGTFDAGDCDAWSYPII